MYRRRYRRRYSPQCRRATGGASTSDQASRRKTYRQNTEGFGGLAPTHHSRRFASFGAHLGRHGNLDEFEVFGGSGLLMRHAPGNHHAVTGTEPRFPAARKFEIDPALENVHKLHVA